jgi:hypothetical protein
MLNFDKGGKSMIAYIYAPGDAECNIPSLSTRVDIIDDYEEDDEIREETREILEKAFSEIWDQKANVVFDDEGGEEHGRIV